MATRTITAMFNTREEAEQAGKMLVSQMGLNSAMVKTSPNAGMTDAGYESSRPYEETGFFGSLKDMLVPEEDRYGYAEGMRRGAVLLSAQVDEGQIEKASDVLEQAGALDLDEQEASWRKSGWTGYDATAHGSMSKGATATSATAGMQAGRDETLKVVQERLVVGKRAVEGGRVKVRAYVIERPVEETIRLHEESVQVDRRTVDRPATAADMDAFQERTIEARAMSEEAVIGKEVRVVEEIGIHKEAAERSQTVRDTVRETKVDVEDTTTTGRTAGATGVTGATTKTGTTTGTAGATPGTGAASAVDRTLNTNVSGTNPGANAPDGTPANPSGTMASRAVDKTLGTNISGANPGNKS